MTPEDGSSGSRDGDEQPFHREQQLPELGRLQINFNGDGYSDDLAGPRELEHHDYGIDTSDKGENYTPPKETEVYDYTDELASKSYTIEEERRVVKKFDMRLTMFMALLYMLSFLDRSSEFSSWYKIAFEAQILRSLVSSRHWERQDRRTGKGPEPYVPAIRMGSYGVLCHIYLLRMDDAHV